MDIRCIVTSDQFVVVVGSWLCGCNVIVAINSIFGLLMKFINCTKIKKKQQRPNNERNVDKDHDNSRQTIIYRRRRLPRYRQQTNSINGI